MAVPGGRGKLPRLTQGFVQPLLHHVVGDEEELCTDRIGPCRNWARVSCRGLPLQNVRDGAHKETSCHFFTKSATCKAQNVDTLAN
jgi:hypothetical protein